MITIKLNILPGASVDVVEYNNKNMAIVEKKIMIISLLFLKKGTFFLINGLNYIQVGKENVLDNYKGRYIFQPINDKNTSFENSSTVKKKKRDIKKNLGE